MPDYRMKYNYKQKKICKWERERERPFMARFAIAPAAILQIVSSKLLLLRSAKSDESPPASTILSWFVSAHSQHEWTFK